MKKLLPLLLVALLAAPGISLAGSDQVNTAPRVLEKPCAPEQKLSDKELTAVSGLGWEQGNQQLTSRIIIWDEWARAAGSGITREMSFQGQIILSGPGLSLARTSLLKGGEKS